MSFWKVVARFCQYEDLFKDGDDIQEATGMLRTKRVGNSDMRKCSSAPSSTYMSSLLILGRGSSGDDLYQFPGDNSLTGTVE